MDKTESCQVCKRSATSRCSACQKVHYCSLQHQREDWIHHKKICFPFTIQNTAQDNHHLGKELIATRNLNAATIILEEAPIFYSPTWEADHLNLICLTCGISMTPEGSKKCSKCQWPMCSHECEKMEIHAANECQIFSNQKINYPPSQFTSQDLSRCILMLRGLELKKNDNLWLDLMTLQHTTSNGDVNLNQNDDELVTKFLNWTKLPASPEDCPRLLQLIEINALQIDAQEQDTTKPLKAQIIPNGPALGVYMKASRLNHSCTPNCTWSIGPPPEFKIRVRTGIDIQKNEPLTICYFSDQNCMGTFERQMSILQLGHFTCQCQRCTDKTELGSFMSAILCQNCSKSDESEEKVGYLLPVDPLDLGEEAMLKCEECKVMVEASKFRSKIEKLELEFRDAEDGMEDEEFLKFCENFIQENETFLHPNHWLLLEAASSAMTHNTRKLGDLDKEGLFKYLDRAMSLLDIEKLVNAGIYCDQGVIKHNIAQALLHHIRQSGTDVSHEEFIENLDASLELQEEAFLFYKNEFSRIKGQAMSNEALDLKIDMDHNRQLMEVLRSREVASA